jgi:hypothetical protein
LAALGCFKNLYSHKISAFNVAGTDEVGITFTRSCKNRRKLLLPKFFANLKTMSPNSGALVGNKIVRATKSSLGCMKLVASIYAGGKRMMMVKTEKIEKARSLVRKTYVRTDLMVHEMFHLLLHVNRNIVTMEMKLGGDSTSLTLGT